MSNEVASVSLPRGCKCLLTGHREVAGEVHTYRCGRQFRETRARKGYPPEVKAHCLKLYLNGLGFRAIERVTGINHNSFIHWVRQAEATLSNEKYDYPESAQLDEL